MNKLYAIHFYIHNAKFGEVCSFNKEEIYDRLNNLGKAGNDAKLIESNDVHDIYRVDVA